jgi:hypothetical protein
MSCTILRSAAAEATILQFAMLVLTSCLLVGLEQFIRSGDVTAWRSHIAL